MSLRRESFGDFSLLRRPGQGTGQVALHFAHATGFNAKTYTPMFEMLDPSIDVYAMDARGHGLSQAPADPRALRSWSRFVRDLQPLIESLPRPTILSGHSMGGTVSLELAARHPSWVAGLILVDPVMPRPRDGVWLPAARAVGFTNKVPIAQAAARRRMEFPSKDAAVDNFEGKGAFRTWPREWIEAYVEGGTEPTADGVRLSCDRRWESRTFATATPRPFRFVKRLQCPVTLLGRRDAGHPLMAESLDEFERVRPSARVLRLEDVSHFMPMERPDIMVEEIHRMVAQVRSELG